MDPSEADVDTALGALSAEVEPGPSRPRVLTGLAAVVVVALQVAVAQSFARFTYGVLLPAIRDDLQVSNTVAGTLGTVNVGAYLVGTLFVAWATTRYRLLAVFRTGSALAVVGLGLAAASREPIVLGIALFILGFGGACAWIPAPVIAAGAMDPEKRAFAIGILGSGMGLGVVFAGQLAALVRSMSGDGAWRSVYLVQCVIGLVVVAASWLLIGHRQGPPASSGGVGGFAALRRTPGWLAITAAMSVFGLLYLLVIAFLTTRLEDDSGWSSGRAALAFTLLGVAMVFGGPVFIALTGRIGARLALAAGFVLWGAATLAVIPGWTVPGLASSIVIGLIFSGVPMMLALYFVTNTTTDDYGPAFAAATLVFGVAQMISPQLGGFLGDLAGSFGPVFLLSAALAAVGAVISLQLPRARAGRGATQ